MSNNGMVATQLHERLGHLLKRVATIDGDLRSAHDRDWVERATETENDEVLEGLDEMSLREVKQIRRALKRIESGHYGVCVGCGSAIGAPRLQAVPTADHCLDCAKQSVGEGATGAPGTVSGG